MQGSDRDPGQAIAPDAGRVPQRSLLTAGAGARMAAAAVLVGALWLAALWALD